jgi:dihydropteroate synthase
LTGPHDPGSAGLHALPAAGRLAPTRIGPRLFEWGDRTYVMGIVNVTPDSFSGDGLLAGTAAREGASVQIDSAAAGATAAAGAGNSALGPMTVEAAVAQARRMVEEGADILDVGGESTRPGHVEVPVAEEAARVVPVIAAIHAALPEIPVSVDTSKPAVAAAAIEAGATLLNDVWGVSNDDGMARLAAAARVPLVVMHNRVGTDYADFWSELMADLRAALDRAVAAGVPRRDLIVDPGFGFGKTPEHNLTVMRSLGELRALGQPILLGTSRKSTIGRVLGGLPPEERLEGTLATTAIGIAAGVDIVRVHDVRANVRAARVADAIARGARS